MSLLKGISRSTFPQPELTDQQAFLDPFNSRPIVKYYYNIFDKFAYASNFGLALDDEANKGSEKRPVLLEDLFVLSNLSEQAVTPAALLQSEQASIALQGVSTIAELLRQQPWMFILSDPGMGKSTLIHWLMLTFGSGNRHRMKDMLGSLVPFALILRDLDVRQVQDWDSLWQAFVVANDQMFKPLGAEPELCAQLFNTGQALFLIDGLDEVSSPQLRTALAEAIREGLSRYPSCKFIITSRIVGFSQAEWFGEEKQQEALTEARRFQKHVPPALEFNKFEGLPTHYLLPFDRGRQEIFVHNWYRQYVPDQASHEELMHDLLERLAQHDGLSELARIPVLLNMICFIHARRGRLPDGRAELYERIAETYLVALDSARRIQFQGREVSLDYEDLSEGLAELALHMQKQRGDLNEVILLPKYQVEDCFSRLLLDIGFKHTDCNAEVVFILDYIAHRSGLFIPRGELKGEEHYAFSHLSFQEYFAAKALLARMYDMEDKEWIEWRNKLNDPQWHETFVLWFELLPKRGVQFCAKQLFGEKAEYLVKEGAENAWLILSTVSMNSAVRLNGKQRGQWIDAAWSMLLSEDVQLKSLSGSAKNLTKWLHVLWRDDFDSMACFLQKVAQCETLSLRTCSIRDFACLSQHLHHLQRFDLSETNVTDLRPIAELKNLEDLNLSDTQVTDLSSLAAMQNLEYLDLSDTQVSELSPLAELKNLESLFLSNTQVSELSPLAELESLEWLSLSDTKVTELSPLAELKNLKSLNLSDTQVTELSPLSEFESLEWLSLSDTKVTELSPLSNLKNLGILHLDDTKADTSCLDHLKGLKIMRE